MRRTTTTTVATGVPERHNYLVNWLMQATRDFSVALTQMYRTQWGADGAPGSARGDSGGVWLVGLVARYLKESR
jgi:hypothetical protein